MVDFNYLPFPQLVPQFGKNHFWLTSFCPLILGRMVFSQLCKSDLLKQCFATCFKNQNKAFLSSITSLMDPFLKDHKLWISFILWIHHHFHRSQIISTWFHWLTSKPIKSNPSSPTHFGWARLHPPSPIANSGHQDLTKEIPRQVPKIGSNEHSGEDMRLPTSPVDPQICLFGKKGPLAWALNIFKEFSNIPLEHTPDLKTTCLWRNSFQVEGLGMPGVCSRGMLGFS